MMTANPEGRTPLTMEDIAARAKEIPAIPDVIIRLSQELEKPQVTAEQLAKLAQLDPRLTTQLLRMCNSAYYGLSREVTSIKEAVAMLGMKTLKSLIYAIMSHQVLDKPMAGYGLGKGDLWRNALAGAVIAKGLAKTFSSIEPDTAFTAAILRDLGKIVLESFVGDGVEEIEQLASNSKLGFEQAESEVLGFSHTELGGYLAEKWTLPHRLTTAIRFHHQPRHEDALNLPADEKKLLALVHLSDALTMMMGEGVGIDGLSYGVDTDFLKEQGFHMTPQYSEQLFSFALQQRSEIDLMLSSVSK